ncbi:MAG: response regulator [Bacteroidetes bacterium]|nr:response regulator [Bacteroidota bacterium]
MEKKKILIVDDDAELLDSLKAILESHEYIIEVAKDGKSGLEMLKITKPDLLILDIMMESTLDGFNTLHKIRDIPAFDQTPVIMFTAMSDSLGVNFRDAIEEVDSLKKVVFLEKTVNPDDLINTIKVLLP